MTVVESQSHNCCAVHNPNRTAVAFNSSLPLRGSSAARSGFVMKEGHGSGFPGHPVNVRDRPNTAPPGVELNNRGNNGSAPTFKSAYFAQSADPLRSAEDGAGGPRTQTGATPAKRAARWKVFAASFLVVAATGFLMVVWWRPAISRLLACVASAFHLSQRALDRSVLAPWRPLNGT